MVSYLSGNILSILSIISAGTVFAILHFHVFTVYVMRAPNIHVTLVAVLVGMQVLVAEPVL